MKDNEFEELGREHQDKKGMILQYTNKVDGNVSCRISEITYQNLMEACFTLKDPTIHFSECNWKIYCTQEELDKFCSEIVLPAITSQSSEFNPHSKVEIKFVSRLFLPPWGYIEFSEETITPDYESLEEFRKILKEQHERNEIFFSKTSKI